MKQVSNSANTMVTIIFESGMSKEITGKVSSFTYVKLIAEKFKHRYVKRIEIEYNTDEQTELWACTQTKAWDAAGPMKYTQWRKFGVFSNLQYVS